MTHSTANTEDLDTTLPMTRDVEPADDDNVDAYETFVIYRDSLVDSSVCQQQSATTTGPPTLGPGLKTLRFNGSMQPGRPMEFNSETAGQALPIGNSMDSHLAYADRIDGLPSGVQLADLDLSPRELPAVPWDNGVDWESDDLGEEESAAPRPNRNPLVSSLSAQPTTISPVQSSSQPTDLYIITSTPKPSSILVHDSSVSSRFVSVERPLTNPC